MGWMRFAVIGVSFLFQSFAGAQPPMPGANPCPPGMVASFTTDGFCCRKAPPPPPIALSGECCKVVPSANPAVNCALPAYNTPISPNVIWACNKAGNGRSCVWDSKKCPDRSNGGGPLSQRICCQGNLPSCASVNSIPVPSPTFPSWIEKHRKCVSGGCVWNSACALP
jgi:hypothetical protein